jgi:hypothetical protein
MEQDLSMGTPEDLGLPFSCLVESGGLVPSGLFCGVRGGWF